MVPTFVDSALKDLSALVSYPTFPDSLKAQIQAFQVDLRFVQMFLRCLFTLDPDNDIDRMLISSTLSSVEGIWDRSGDGLYTAGLQAMKKKFQVWNRLSSKLGDKIQQCKLEIKNYCVQFMSPSFQSKLFRGDQILEFIDEILNSSNNILHLPAAENQFKTLTEKLLSLKHIVDFTARRCPDDVKVLTDFMIHAHTWANKAACLACLYWASDAEDEGRNEIRMNLWIADLLRKVNPCTPEFIQMCFAAMKSSRADATFLYNEFFISFTDFMVETMALKDFDDEIVVGFDAAEQVLIEQITRGTPNLGIVPIVGMGGLGKTTLTRKLFNKPYVRNHFHVCAFSYVGQDHDTKRLLLEILSEFIVFDDAIHEMKEEDLAFKLYQCLKGRRYLIIMDDIWDVGPWEGVKKAFPDDDNGSRIVFTTQNSDVPEKVSSNCNPHYLRFLSTEKSWELLQAKVFHKRPCPSHLKEVGLLIAKKCQGLPLAVVVIAGFLARKPESWSSWNEIAENLIFHLSTEGCMYILELSYKHLPEALKSCLLYFGAFLQKKYISAKRLMLLWAAEGFVPKSSESSSNFLSIAKQYLNDLVHRSLVIVHQRSSTGGIKRCKVHDLVRELCRRKAREENFFHFIERSNGSNISSVREIYKHYRLCIHVNLETEDNAKPTGCHSTAHTLIYYYPNSPCSVDALPLSNAKLVQVLDVKAECDTFPEEVTRLVNLRYLTLKTHTLSSVHIPSIIANLWNLETFVLKCFSNKKIYLPETIWKMKSLKHVDVGREAVVELDNEVGKDSSKLPNIESFSSVTITYGESGVELLRRLSNVRKLSCYYYTCLDWQKKFEQLPKLDEYLTKLESLNIVSDGAFYPWLPSFPITLKKLSLEGVDLPWTKFYAIAKLPCLEVLKLMPKAFRGSRWDVVDEKNIPWEFPNLKLLKLYGLDVEEWIASEDTFPCLEQIVVKSCYNLVQIPFSFAEVPTLKVIEVYDCEEGVGEAAIQIQEEQLEMGNMIQVQVITQ